MDNKLTINVSIGERLYPLTIDRKDEAKIRQATKDINDTIEKYKELYKDSSMQNLLAMTALQYATRMIELEEHHEVLPLIDELNKIDDRLSDILDNED